MRTKIPKKVRDLVKAKFDGRCGYCGKKPERLQIDHIKPVIRGGSDEIDNLMPACFSCNNYKISYSLEQFRTELQSQIHRARESSLNFRLAERFGLIAILDVPIRFYFEKVNDAEKTS